MLALGGLTFGFVDSDLDGVEDSRDQCPNTPILELVDERGCPIKEVIKPKVRFYLRVGGGYIKDKREERTFSSLSVAFSWKKLYMSFSSKYYTSSKLYGSGMGNSYLFGGLSFYPTESLYLMPGLRVKIPTADRKFGDKYVDYSPTLSVDYFIGRLDLFSYASYTFRGNPNLKNTYFLSLGAGYDFTEKLYLSISTDFSQSAVSRRINRYLTIFSVYDINERLYTTLNYSKGLNSRAVDHSLSVRIGVRF